MRFEGLLGSLAGLTFRGRPAVNSVEVSVIERSAVQLIFRGENHRDTENWFGLFLPGSVNLQIQSGICAGVEGVFRRIGGRTSLAITVPAKAAPFSAEIFGVLVREDADLRFPYDFPSVMRDDRAPTRGTRLHLTDATNGTTWLWIRPTDSVDGYTTATCSPELDAPKNREFGAPLTCVFSGKWWQSSTDDELRALAEQVNVTAREVWIGSAPMPSGRVLVSQGDALPVPPLCTVVMPDRDRCPDHQLQESLLRWQVAYLLFRGTCRILGAHWASWEYALVNLHVALTRQQSASEDRGNLQSTLVKEIEDQLQRATDVSIREWYRDTLSIVGRLYKNAVSDPAAMRLKLRCVVDELSGSEVDHRWVERQLS